MTHSYYWREPPIAGTEAGHLGGARPPSRHLPLEADDLDAVDPNRRVLTDAGRPAQAPRARRRADVQHRTRL